MFGSQNAYGAVGHTADMSVDAGLRGFMLGVYNKMALGLLLSAIIAYVVGTVPPITQLVFNSPLYFVVAFGPLVVRRVQGEPRALLGARCSQGAAG